MVIVMVMTANMTGNDNDDNDRCNNGDEGTMFTMIMTVDILMDSMHNYKYEINNIIQYNLYCHGCYYRL